MFNIQATHKNNVAFIDGAFLHKIASKVVGIEVDYLKLRDWLYSNGFNKLWFYNSVVFHNNEDEQPAVRLFDFIATNGYSTEIDEYEPDDYKFGFDVKIAVRAMQAAEWADNFLFVTSSSALLPLFQILQNYRVRTHLLSGWSEKAKKQNVAVGMAVRREADFIYSIEEIIGSLKKEKDKK